MPLLTNAMHRGYGTALGVVHAVAAPVLPPRPLVGGLVFGAAVAKAYGSF